MARKLEIIEIAELLGLSRATFYADFYKHKKGSTLRMRGHCVAYLAILDKLAKGESVYRDEVEAINKKTLSKKHILETRGISAQMIGRLAGVQQRSVLRDIEAVKNGKNTERLARFGDYRDVIVRYANGEPIQAEDLNDIKVGMVEINKKRDEDVIRAVLASHAKWAKQSDLKNHNADSLTNGRLVL